MSRYAIIENSIVVNIIEWDGVSKYTPPVNTTLIDITSSCDIGWSYQNEGFVEPEDQDEE